MTSDDENVNTYLTYVLGKRLKGMNDLLDKTKESVEREEDEKTRRREKFCSLGLKVCVY